MVRSRARPIPTPSRRWPAGGTMPRSSAQCLRDHRRLAPSPGYIGFCIRQPDQCKTPDGAASQMILTPANWKTLDQVNRTTNDENVWQGRRSEAYYGRVPNTGQSRQNGYGDCEDIVLAKRKKLMDMGMPVPSLRVAVVITPKHESHAVLTGGPPITATMSSTVFTMKSCPGTRPAISGLNGRIRHVPAAGCL